MSRDACYCGYEPLATLSVRRPVARQVHKCCDCRRPINVGERYERVVGISDGGIDVYTTCGRCVSVREWVAGHIPCFCWAYGNLSEDVRETLHYHDDVPGLRFGAGRRYLRGTIEPLEPAR